MEVGNRCKSTDVVKLGAAVLSSLLEVCKQDPRRKDIDLG